MLERIYELKERLAIRRLMFPSLDHAALMNSVIGWMTLFAIAVMIRAAYVIITQVPIRVHSYRVGPKPEPSWWWQTVKDLAITSAGLFVTLLLAFAAGVCWQYGDKLYDTYGIGRTRERVRAVGLSVCCLFVLTATCLYW